MKSTTVRLKIRVRLPDGSRPFLDPVRSSNSKLKPHYALVDGKPEHHPEGRYFLRYAPPGGKRVWEPVGRDPQLAMQRHFRKQKELEARNAGVEVKAEAAIEGTRLEDTINEYLDEVGSGKARKTQAAYSLTLRDFARVCSKEFVDDVDRKDILAFVRAMRDAGHSARTQSNRLAYLKTFMNRWGMKWPLLKTDRIRFTEKAVVAYKEPQLAALFQHANEEEQDLLSFFLNTGCRDGEVQHATWAELDFVRNVYTVRERLDLGFTPKDREEGSIPVSDKFLEQMRKRKANSDSRLIFPGRNGKQNGHFLRILKRIAFKAGLNCGGCFDDRGRSCSAYAICNQHILHRFRKTFATMHHEAGVPARRIQKWLRHSDLGTTLRYLDAGDDDSLQTRHWVNSAFAQINAR